jgi:hypothetical protein
MTATHNAPFGALSKYSHFDEFSEHLNVRGNILTPSQRRALAMANLQDTLANTPTLITTGAGITAGVGTVVSAERLIQGNRTLTRIYIDLTGLASSTTDLDIIGVSTPAAYLAQITAALHGAPSITGRMVCLETPAGGADDIDLYAATEATGAFDAGIGTLAETAIVTSGGAWVVGLSKPFIASIAANAYLYLTGGEAGTAATYTAGRFMIEIEGSTFVGT